MTPRLSRQISLVTGWELPPWSSGPTELDQLFEAVADAGYEGIQVPLTDFVASARSAGLDRVSGLGVARTPDEVADTVAAWAGQGVESVVLHLGTGFEDDGEASALLDALQRAEADHEMPVLVETHRGTITQDPARTLRLIEQMPDLRFCADLSHWYTGVELVYGDFDAKLARLAPVFERTRMIHGRISDPGCIQVAVEADDRRPHVEHFRAMWSAVLVATAAAGMDDLPFVVELLPASAGYARAVERDGERHEEVDRWAQADVLWRTIADLEVTP